jgi:DNA-binding CsgD family transcriptional regulator
VKELLHDSKQQLANPLGDARRKLLIILNVLFVILVTAFLCSEKLTTGNFVPHPSLLLIYIPAVLLNFISAVYNIYIFKYEENNSSGWKKDIYIKHKKIDSLVGWVSFMPITIMSFCNLIGMGNPSSDAILTDFGLATTLIIGAVIIIGRKGAVAWFIIVVALLFWNVSTLGWDHEYHYSTPSEAAKYKNALKDKKGWALIRKAELESHNLNPPKVTRYFNIWLVNIIVAFMAAYFFSGITIDIFKIIPSVITNIEGAIEDSKRKDVELETKQKEITKSAMRIVRYNEILEEFNMEIEKLNYKEKKKLVKVINAMRKALDKETDWEHFETNFDSIHSNFFKAIQEKHSSLSQSEMKHLAYIRINLSSAEISRLMNIKIESLRTLRYRLKKKLNLNEDIDLRDFTTNIELIE